MRSTRFKRSFISSFNPQCVIVCVYFKIEHCTGSIDLCVDYLATHFHCVMERKLAFSKVYISLSVTVVSDVSSKRERDGGREWEKSLNLIVHKLWGREVGTKHNLLGQYSRMWLASVHRERERKKIGWRSKGGQSENNKRSVFFFSSQTHRALKKQEKKQTAGKKEIDARAANASI